MDDKTVEKMTRKDFEAVPLRERWDKDVICEQIVILPGHSRDLHDSGWRNMDFVAVKNNKPICRLSGNSDVLHIDGIGGFGHDWLHIYGHVPTAIKPKGWAFDCLAKSGLLRLWCDGYDLICAAALSSFEVYAVRK